MIDKADLRFDKRTRRPPRNPVNAMLSFGYLLLAVDCQSALQAAGLDPAVGFLHADRSRTVGDYSEALSERHLPRDWSAVSRSVGRADGALHGPADIIKLG
jgi:hypothetical protein